MHLLRTIFSIVCFMGLLAVAQQPAASPEIPASPPVATTPQETPPPQPSTITSPPQETLPPQSAVTTAPQQETPAIPQAPPIAEEKPASPSVAPTLPMPEPTTATVYVYRYKQFVGSALSPSVYCDEVQLARMDNGRYFTVKLPPGKHAFRSNDKQSGLELDLKAGQPYFIRVEIAPGFMKGHGRLIQMTAEQGSYELKSKKLLPLDASKAVDRTLVSVEQAQLE